MNITKFNTWLKIALFFLILLIIVEPVCSSEITSKIKSVDLQNVINQANDFIVVESIIEFELLSDSVSVEDFESAQIGLGGVNTTCLSPININSSDSCFNSGTLINGFSIYNTIPGERLGIFGINPASGHGKLVTALPSMYVAFDSPDTHAVAFNLHSSNIVPPSNVHFEILDSMGIVIGSSSVLLDQPDSEYFIGFITTSIISRINIVDDQNGSFVFIDALRFGLHAETDVAVTLSADTTEPINIHDEFNVTIELVNNGPLTASNVMSTLSIPQSLSFISSTCASIQTGVVAYHINNLNSFESSVCSFRVRVESSFPSINMIAEVEMDQIDSFPSNNVSLPLTIALVETVIPVLSSLGLVFLILCITIAGLFNTTSFYRIKL